MRKSTTKAVFTLWAIFALFGMSTSCLAVGEPMRLVQTIPLPELHEGDFDHFAVDLPGHRLFLTVEQGVVEMRQLFRRAAVLIGHEQIAEPRRSR